MAEQRSLAGMNAEAGTTRAEEGAEAGAAAEQQQHGECWRQQDSGWTPYQALRAQRATGGRQNAGWAEVGEGAERQQNDSAGFSSKRAKARQHTAGVDTGGSRVHKHRMCKEDSRAGHRGARGIGTVEVEAALEHAERWIDQWDRLVWNNSSGHLLRSLQRIAQKGVFFIYLRAFIE